MITTTPAVSNGRVVFGCDDGFLYVLGSGGQRKPVVQNLDLHEPRGQLRPATGRTYDWATPSGDQANTRFVDDAKLKPPFQLRWAVRSFGLFHQPVSAARQDLVFVSMARTVACLEQQTGRMRWRRRLPRQSTQFQGVLCADGKIYIARPLQQRAPYQSVLWCLDQETGSTLWRQDIGTGTSGVSKTPPVLTDGCVAFASFQGDPPKPVVQAWDAQTGEPKWQVPLNVAPKRERQRVRPPTGCALGDVMFFSVGGMTDNDPQDRYPGESVAIQARTGKVLWRTKEAFTTGYSSLAARDNRLYVFSYAGPMSCLSTTDGSLIWKSKQANNYFQHGPSLGPDFFAVKGYGGHTSRYSLANCQPQNVKSGAPDHTCSSGVLTSSELSLVASVGGLYVRNFNTGELLWHSAMGFAPRNCANPAIASGRIFVNPQVTGMLYCFEPDESEP